jgi:GNAT superfamily N-acetyltransferase
MSEIVVRPAAEADVPEILRMGRSFHEQTAYARVVSLNVDAVAARVRRLIAGEGFAQVAMMNGEHVGMLGASLTAPWFNPDYRVTQELYWWVEPSVRELRVGSRLLEQLEAWWPQHSNGLLMLRTPNIDTERMDALYRAKGFIPWDGYYMKVR